METAALSKVNRIRGCNLDNEGRPVSRQASVQRRYRFFVHIFTCRRDSSLLHLLFILFATLRWLVFCACMKKKFGRYIWNAYFILSEGPTNYPLGRGKIACAQIKIDDENTNQSNLHRRTIPPILFSSVDVFFHVVAVVWETHSRRNHPATKSLLALGVIAST